MNGVLVIRCVLKHKPGVMSLHSVLDTIGKNGLDFNGVGTDCFSRKNRFLIFVDAYVVGERDAQVNRW